MVQEEEEEAPGRDWKKDVSRFQCKMREFVTHRFRFMALTLRWARTERLKRNVLPKRLNRNISKNVGSVREKCGMNTEVGNTDFGEPIGVEAESIRMASLCESSPFSSAFIKPVV
jgi:hypothetical protein